MIVGGGPSLNEHIDTIRHKRADVVKLFSLNGPYKWSLDYGITPFAMVQVVSSPVTFIFNESLLQYLHYFIFC